MQTHICTYTYMYRTSVLFTESLCTHICYTYTRMHVYKLHQYLLYVYIYMNSTNTYIRAHTHAYRNMCIRNLEPVLTLPVQFYPHGVFCLPCSTSVCPSFHSKKTMVLSHLHTSVYLLNPIIDIK